MLNGTTLLIADTTEYPTEYPNRPCATLYGTLQLNKTVAWADWAAADFAERRCHAVLRKGRCPDSI